MRYFKFEQGKIRVTTFDVKTVKELIDGPYVFKLECDEFGALYYAGSNDDLWHYLKNTGRFVLPLSDLIGHVWLNTKKNLDDIRNMTWDELLTEVRIIRKIHPDIIEIENSPPNDKTLQSNDQAAKFCQLLA